MKWLLAIWRMRRVPTWRELPGLYLRAVVFGILTGPVFQLFMEGVPAFSLLSMAISCFIGAAFSISFFTACGIGNAWLRTRVQDQPRAIVSTAFIGYNAMAAPAAFVAATGMVSLVLDVKIPWFWRTIVFEAVLGIVLSIIIGSFLKLKEQVEKTQTELRQQEVATARAQAMALQAQINPHFFFNTLNSISALIDRDPKAAQRMIGLLAGMFRYTFGSSSAPEVRLEEELRFVSDYLSIEQARFSGRLQVDLPQTSGSNVRLPGLVLQPLVENAVRHGIAHLVDGGNVRIGVDGLRVTVRNTADPSSIPEPASVFRPGHALENVRSRLRLYLGVAEPLEFRHGPDWVEFSFCGKAAD